MNDPYAAATAVYTLAVSIAKQLPDEELALCAALFTQFADTLASIAACRIYHSENQSEDPTNPG